MIDIDRYGCGHHQKTMAPCGGKEQQRNQRGYSKMKCNMKDGGFPNNRGPVLLGANRHVKISSREQLDCPLCAGLPIVHL